MSTPDTSRRASRARGTSGECCPDPACESGLRNHYFEGKRLTPDMFLVEQRYQLERRRLLNRAVHGWGVVYGYAVAVAGSTSQGGQRGLSLGAGLALDRCGRELIQAGPRRIALAEVIAIDGNGRRVEDAGQMFSAEHYRRKHEKKTCWLLSAHYAEQNAGPVRVADPCHCDDGQWDHVCETVRYTLRRVPCDQCCADDDCELTCTCGTGRCCSSGEDDPDDDDDREGDRNDDDQARARAHADDRGTKDRRRPHRHGGFRRGGCRCLCDHLTGLAIETDCGGTLCEVDEPCGPLRVDLRHGVPLACVGVVRDECGDWTFDDEVDACGPRRLVKRNDLLFDLVRGCDLTHIVEIGWSRWHRREQPVAFDAFQEAMGADGRDQAEYVTRDFWVRFSRPVRKDTLRPDAVAMTVMSADTEGGWWQPMRVPVVRLETASDAEDPDGHVREARLVVLGSWLEDGCRGRHSVFFAGDTWVEIEVRGDLIVDCNGQAVDADARGLSRGPTGNGTPGGTFLSSFRVARRETPGRSVPPETASRGKGASS